jgi:hypothetical protein
MMGQAKPGTICVLTGTGPGLACQDAAGWVGGRVWNRTEPFWRSESRPRAGYPDPLLTLCESKQCKNVTALSIATGQCLNVSERQSISSNHDENNYQWQLMLSG